MIHRSKSDWLFALVLLWLMIVTGFYFVGHKPADSEQLAALLRWLPGLVMLFLQLQLLGGQTSSVLRRLFSMLTAIAGHHWRRGISSVGQARCLTQCPYESIT